jgi:pimeloyl-ACP methyl ester carboxylesterase
MFVLVEENQVYYNGSEQPLQPELPTLVFIHGAMNNHSVWNLKSQHGYNVVALDLPGHGLSQGKAKTSIEEMAQWLLAFFDAAGIKKAGIIGHSMGSLIALETARIAPLRVAKLALLGNAYPMRVADALLSTARENEAAAIDMVTKWSHYKTADPVVENTKQLMLSMAEINPHHLLYTDLSACNNYAQGEQATAVINHHHCPTLFVMAKQDRMTPDKASVKLREAISEAKVVEIADCGHAMMSEQPDAVLSALADFFR